MTPFPNDRSIEDSIGVYDVYMEQLSIRHPSLWVIAIQNGDASGPTTDDTLLCTQAFAERVYRDR